MATRVIRTTADIDGLVKLLKSRDMPQTVTVRKGAIRTNPQNRLQQMWFAEAAEQLEGMTPTDMRAHCKLHYGVPILRMDNPDFAEKYDKFVKHRPYEDKLAFMVEPFDFPVTRLMTKREKAQYLDTIQRELTEMGVVLTDPEALKYAGAA